MSRLGKNLRCFSSDLSVKYIKGLGLIKNTFWKKLLSCWLDNEQKWSIETPAKIALEKQCGIIQTSRTESRHYFFETRLIRASLLSKIFSKMTTQL